MSISKSKKGIIQQLPKSEIHYHLEGSIQPETVFDLAEKNDVELPFDSVNEQEEFYEELDSLQEFIENAFVVTEVLQTADDFERVTVEVGADAARQNVPYREVFMACAGYTERGIPWEEVVDGVATGRKRVSEKYDVELAFIPCVDRTQTSEMGVKTVERVAAYREKLNAVGIGLAGNENGYPAHRHRPAFERAEELLFPRVAHAGEAAGPGSVWDALLALDVDRIDHGVRAIEDEILIEYLNRRQVPLTTCPVSNVSLNIYDKMADHPVAELLDRELLVTVNSDDPPMFGADLTENYLAVAETFDLSPEAITTLVKNSFEASFLGEKRTAEFCERVDTELARLKTDGDGLSE